MVVKNPPNAPPKDSTSQPKVVKTKKSKSKKGTAGKKAKSDVLGNMTNADINALLTAAAALQGQLFF